MVILLLPFVSDELTLFGTGGDTFIQLSFLDQIFFKNFQTFLEEKLTSLGLF